MRKEFEYDAFLSHDCDNHDVVGQLARRLEARGLRVWFDRIDPGDDIVLAVDRGLEQSRTLVLCMSPEALGSNWVSLERSTTVFRNPNDSERRFIPLLLATCDPPDTLKRYKFLDYRNASQSAFDTLVACCRPGDARSHVEYSYPDFEDQITLATILALEPEPGYWSYSEDVMRRDFLDPLLAELKTRHDATAIDVGCGTGRLLPWLATYCRSLTALEPDPVRLASARAQLDANIARRTEFAQARLESLDPHGEYDLVFCSHVLQHVRRARLPELLAKLRALCAPRGRVILLTTHAPTDHFVAARLDANRAHREDRVTPEEFDRLFESPTGDLPIHFFSRPTLARLLEQAGLRVLDDYVFHCCQVDFGDLERHGFRDAIANGVPFLKERLGRDIAVVAAPI